MEQIGRQEVPSGNMETDLPKIRKKRGPNRFDQEQEYDIIEDFINQKANITYGQLMKNSSNQMAKMRKAMTRPLIKEDNWLHSGEKQINNIEGKEKTVAARCDVILNNTEIKAIIDTGAATNILTNSLAQKLKIKPTQSSKTYFTIANGKREASLGKTQIEIELGEYIIPLNVEIIESFKADLLLGTEFLNQIQGKIDFEKRELIFQIDKEKIEVPIYYTQRLPTNQEDEENSEDNYEENYESDGTEIELQMTDEVLKNNPKSTVLAETVERQ